MNRPAFFSYHLRSVIADLPFTKSACNRNGDDSSFDLQDNTPPAKQRRALLLKSTLLFIGLIFLRSVAKLTHDFHPYKGVNKNQVEKNSSTSLRKATSVDVSKKERIIAKLEEQSALIKILQQQFEERNALEHSHNQIKPSDVFLNNTNSKKRKRLASPSPSLPVKDELAMTLRKQAQLISLLQKTILAQNELMSEIAKDESVMQLRIPESSFTKFLSQQSPDQLEAAPSGNSFALLHGAIQQDPNTKVVLNKTIGALPAQQAASSISLQSLELSGYKNAWDVREESDTPVFWEISKAGVTAFKKIMGECHHLVVADDRGVLEGHDADKQLAIVKIDGDLVKSIQPLSHVNVDTTSHSGLQKAKDLGLVKSGLADVIVIRNLFQADDLFDVQHRGRLFALFRHPVERAFSIFNYLKHADWEPTYSAEMSSMTLEQFVKSPLMESDWLTRQLSNQLYGPLSQQNLFRAMDILRRKVLVGLLEKKELSMARFEKYFDWKFKVQPEFQESCRTAYLGSAAIKWHRDERLPPDSLRYDLLASYNKFDVQLYSYVKTLFEEQAQFTMDAPDGYRLNLFRAMDILRRKVLVGLLEEKELSMARFEKYFDWKFKVQPEFQESCRTAYLGSVAIKSHRDERLPPDSLPFDLLASYNKFDVQLYSYIKTLFEEQAQFTMDAPDGYRLVDATCCICDKTCC